MGENRQYIVIGLANKADPCFSEEVTALLRRYTVFSGGGRHYALIKQWLPAGHTWISIKGDMVALFAAYRQAATPVVVFASGDPLFYGMVQTIQKYDAAAGITVYPHFNSVQRLCAKIGQPYQEVKNTSVHGRNWQELDEALLHGKPLIAVLTDAVRDPKAIARRLMDYRFTQYDIIIGEDLDGEQECIRTCSPEQALQLDFQPLNVVLLRQVRAATQPVFGIDDHLFKGLEGRPNMITKKAVRLLSLSCLQLNRARVFWDIGFCTGSVAIEARRLFPHLQVHAFEKCIECGAIMEYNTQQLAAPGITMHIGDFFACNHEELSAPDAVFIGGHGNRLAELMQLMDPYLPLGATVVMNTVLGSSQEQFVSQAAALHWHLSAPQTIKADEHNPITILAATKSSAIK
ncbi:MAG: bifunctional cobalt-precorrin-7 (C(5))-methyltransferase/cobalt-precorrin-6B (C(15))-methyltransferase [Sediminibacterium sp.]